MFNLLIPYVRLTDHSDPLFDEFTYGDVGTDGNKLKKNLKKGSFVFFHTTIRGHKYITAYYVVDRILDTSEVVKDKLLLAKYKNPHIKRYLSQQEKYDNDVIVFGDTIYSKRLPRPLPFDRALVEKLSLGIPFTPNRTEVACIVSATRAWRELTGKDVDTLLKKIKKIEEQPFAVDALLSTDEVTDLREIDLEDFIARNPKCLGEDLKLIKRQFDVTPNDKIDLLLEDKDGADVVVELKLGVVSRKELNQIKRYMHQIRKADKPVRGILVCKNILPVFENAFKSSRDIKVCFYGWKFGLKPAEL